MKFGKRKGMVWYGMVWYGMVWYGMVWYGMVWYGLPLAALIFASVNIIVGIMIYRGKLRDFADTLSQKPDRHRLLGCYFIIIGAIIFSSASAVLLRLPGMAVYVTVSALAVSVVLSLIRKENI